MRVTYSLSSPDSPYGLFDGCKRDLELLEVLIHRQDYIHIHEGWNVESATALEEVRSAYRECLVRLSCTHTQLSEQLRVEGLVGVLHIFGNGAYLL